jgi:hypothetical protein
MQDQQDTGIPTREIHEAFLTLKKTRHHYREARDDPTSDEQGPHRAYQEAVLSFYASLRPYLKRKSAMERYWAGELPEYPERPFNSVPQAHQYYTQHGVAIWALQKHTHTMRTSPNTQGVDPSELATDGGATTLSEWHDHLNLTDNQRLVAVDWQGDELAWVEFRAVSGLQQLDTWDTERVRTRERGDGFMAGEGATREELQFVDVAKLEKARRLLIEAADKMSLLARVEIDHENGAIVNFDQSRDDAEPRYTEADYDETPDI